MMSIAAPAVAFYCDGSGETGADAVTKRTALLACFAREQMSTAFLTTKSR